jgi:hypothetical protein
VFFAARNAERINIQASFIGTKVDGVALIAGASNAN